MSRHPFGAVSRVRAVCGVDGCRGGWVAVCKNLDSGTITAGLFGSFEALAYQALQPQVLAIDIPIGLPERGARECDSAARRVLGRPRSSSVFPAPPRGLLAARSHADASQRRQRIEGKGLSVQTWNIVPRIREVDAALRRDPTLRQRVHEAHPEVSFCVLRGRPMQHGKKSAAGRCEREALLRRIFGRAVAETLARPAELVSAADDICDAFALLWTAERIASGEARRWPKVPQVDRYGLLMQIIA